MKSMDLQSKLGAWYPYLSAEFEKPYMLSLRESLKKEMSQYEVYPKSDDVFNAFRLTDPLNIKVVIIGQDPYHTPGMANGLAFSVRDGLMVEIPPSLRNIFKEIDNDIKFQPYHNPDLTRWAKQGVLLLNRTLTVRKGLALSHNNIGWELFTKNVINILSDLSPTPIVFMLWGKHAQECISFYSSPHHTLISPHPSPFSARMGFFGCRHFSEANKFLKLNEIEPISWLE